MIVYFSGTGNSRYVASELAARTADKAVQLLDVKKIDCDVLGIVCPVYSWGIAPVILKQIEDWSVTSCPAYVWVVLTCGDDTGMAHKMLSGVLRRKGLSPDSVWSIQMPNTYVLLPGFDVDSPDVERQKIEKLPARLEEIAGFIQERQRNIVDVVKGSNPRLKTKIVYPLFVRFGIRPGKFHASDSCVGCGRCAELCPVGNISMNDSHGHSIPVWGNRCTSCLACYHGCPAEAVSYGAVTRRKGHYRRWQ